MGLNRAVHSHDSSPVFMDKPLAEATRTMVLFFVIPQEWDWRAFYPILEMAVWLRDEPFNHGKQARPS